MKSLIVLLLVPFSLYAGESRLTGNLRTDLLVAMAPADSLPQPEAPGAPVGHKSPILGGALSLVVPGAGQYYTGNYIMTGVFLVAEAAAVTAVVVYNHKGDTQTSSFQNYADANWSAVKYAEWINAHAAADYGYGPDPSIQINGNQSLPSWERVSVAQINAWEAGQHTEGFSHQLPSHGSQQYYELIGKYNQYKFGWAQYPVDNAGTPVSDGGAYNDLIPAQMLSYAKDRGKANDFYNYASAASWILVANHFLSALDGALSAQRYNKAVEASVRMGMEDHGTGGPDLVTRLQVSVKF